MLLAVMLLSLLPVADVGVNDKLLHLLAYFILAGWFGLLVTGLAGLGWTVAGLFIYGLLIELLQSTTGYRYAEWGDVLANSIGIVIGILLYFSPLTRVLRFVDSRLARVLSR